MPAGVQNIRRARMSMQIFHRYDEAKKIAGINTAYVMQYIIDMPKEIHITYTLFENTSNSTYFCFLILLVLLYPIVSK